MQPRAHAPPRVAVVQSERRRPSRFRRLRRIRRPLLALIVLVVALAVGYGIRAARSDSLPPPSSHVVSSVAP
jgi:hypothetical protein